jgi:hypothetical protein
LQRPLTKSQQYAACAQLLLLGKAFTELRAMDYELNKNWNNKLIIKLMEFPQLTNELPVIGIELSKK